MVPAAMGEGVRLNADNDVGALQMDESIQILDGASVSLELNGGLELETGVLDLSGETGGQVKTEGGTDEVTLEGQVEEETGADTTQTGAEDAEGPGQETGAGSDAAQLPDALSGIELEMTDAQSDQSSFNYHDMSNEECLEGYLQSVLPGLGSQKSNQWARAGRQNLVDKSLTGSVKLYDLLESKIKAVSGGKQKSTKFSFTDKQMGLNNSWWTAKELGGDSLSDDAYKAALMKKEGFDPDMLKWALWADYPYDLYWFDRSRPSAFLCEVVYKKENGKVTKARLSKVQFCMRVVREYEADKFEINKFPKQIKTAAANIKKIVNKYKKLDDYSKLKAYADEICKLADWGYSQEGAYDDSFHQSLIPVFDGDKKTDTVCSGFSKAFKYLVDISKFKGNVCCEMVRGRVVGPDNGPAHAWNVVYMPDGRYYLVDTSGGDRPDGCLDALFMKGAIGENGYPYVCNSRNYILIDEEFINLYGKNSPWMKLSKGDYGKDYEVVIDAKNGSMTATPSIANPGETVKLTVSPSLGCKSATPNVKFGASGKKVALKKVNSTTWSFKMPYGEVYAQVEFAPKSKNWHTINSIGTLKGGTLIAKVGGKETKGADKGKTVTLTATSDKGYKIATPKVTNAGKKVAVKKAGKNKWTFVMPDNEVEVAGVFQVDKTWDDLQKRINKAKNGSTIKLTKNITAGTGNVGLTIPAKKKITLDLAGHTLDRGLTDAAPLGYVIEVLGELTLKDSKSKGKLIGGYNAEHGGAIVVSKNAKLTLVSGILDGNKSAFGGGAIYVHPKGAFTMKGGTIKNSVSHGFGAVYVDGGRFEMKGGSINGNTVLGEGFGGGVYMSDSSLTMSGGTISGNKAQDGGGLYLDRNSFTMSGGTISNNTCDKNGGGLLVYNNDCRITGGTISGNTSNDSGGGICLTHGALKLGSCTISDNTAKGESYGGGIYISDGSLNIEGTKIKGNAAGSGGGVYVRQSRFEMKDGAVTNNKSVKDGGGLTIGGKDCKMIGGSVSRNVSGGRGGGVSLIPGASFTISGGTLSDNTALDGNYGGGAYVSKGSLLIENAKIVGNKGGTGGGVFSSEGSLTMNNCSVENNSASDLGGGIYVVRQDWQMTNGKVSGNTSGSHGGGICIVQGDFKLSGGTVSGNTASGEGRGGGVYVTNGSLQMEGGSINANKAGTGGGVFVYQSPMNMTGGSITGNTATSLAGGVYYSNTTLKVSGSPVISDNKCTASDGGGAQDVYLLSTYTIIVGGALSSEARIGVYIKGQSTHVFTEGLGRDGNIDAFFSNNNMMTIARSDDGQEAALTRAQ